jgi:hypothetical protein
MNYFGVPLQPGQKVCILEGEVRWANYGRKSYRRVGYAFVFDDKGFVAKHRLHYYYADNGTFSAPAPLKTELNQWVRDESIPAPEFAPPPKIEAGEWVGVVGEFFEAEVTVKSMRYIGPGPFGSIWQTKMVDDAGNTIIYWNTLKVDDVAQVDYKIRLRAKVKEHTEYKGVKQTVVGYAKIRDFL